MAGRILTVDQLITQIRDDLDEPRDAETNFWSQTFLLGRLNRGLREVWETVRETHENYFIRRFRSDDPPFTVYDRLYDPSTMRLVNGRTELLLPPDFHELRYFEPVRALADDADDGIVFHIADFSKEKFRVLARNTGPSIGGGYYYDVEWRTEGPTIVLVPTIGLDASRDVELRYVFGLREYKLGDTFENSGFESWMLDAVVAYTILEARKKEENNEQIAVARAEWERKRAFCQRIAGPRQTVEPETTDGYLEEEIF